MCFPKIRDEDELIYKNKFGYHYTSPDGLKCILKESTLRFTDCQFLNDKSEFVNFNNVIVKAKKSRKVNQDAGQMFHESIDKMINGAPMDIDINTDGVIQNKWYVFCTTIQRDSLQMWNYYIKNNKYEGYNIGFNLRDLAKRLSKEFKKNLIEAYFSKVKYNEKNQIGELVYWINYLFDEFKKECAKNKFKYNFVEEAIKKQFNAELIKIINVKRLFYKNSCFKHEEEFRFIIKIPINETFFYDNQEAFIKNGIFVPYFDVNIDKSIIKNITLSPLLESDIARHGLKIYLEHNGYYNVDIKQSKIPVRYGW
jgi:hypothetical protein